MENNAKVIVCVCVHAYVCVHAPAKIPELKIQKERHTKEKR